MSLIIIIIFNQRREGEENKTFIYRRQLLKSKLEAFGVVRYAFGGDVLHGILEHFLVPHIRLHQMVKTSRLLHSGVKLKRKERWEKKKQTQKTFSKHSFHSVERQATHAAPPFIESLLLHLALA